MAFAKAQEWKELFYHADNVLVSVVTSRAPDCRRYPPEEELVEACCNVLADSASVYRTTVEVRKVRHWRRISRSLGFAFTACCLVGGRNAGFPAFAVGPILLGPVRDPREICAVESDDGWVVEDSSRGVCQDSGANRCIKPVAYACKEDIEV